MQPPKGLAIGSPTMAPGSTTLPTTFSVLRLHDALAVKSCLSADQEHIPIPGGCSVSAVRVWGYFCIRNHFHGSQGPKGDCNGNGAFSHLNAVELDGD